MWISDSLDIVIPAYKARFLPLLLQSLINQTSKNFSVIVADDASPEPLHPICEEFGDRLPIRYVRFERNLGATDLAGHWNRSVKLSHAQWVLLPGDDDALEENCIESFWNTVTACHGKFDLYSYGVRFIDQNGSILRDGIPPAATTSAGQFLRQRLQNDVSSVPAAYVFSREIFEALGGFVSFDRGWHSDDATWAIFGARKGIQPITNAFVRWRSSPLNISPVMVRDGFRSAQATLAFYSWIIANQSNLSLTRCDVRQLTDELLCWRLYAGIADASRRAWAPAAWRTARCLHRHGSKTLLRHLFRCARARAIRPSAKTTLPPASS